MRHMTTLRMLALCSNFAFILYGLAWALRRSGCCMLSCFL
jgi:hypothetical protein